MSIEKTSSAIDTIKQSAADARQAEEAAERDCENLNAQIEIVRANETEEIANSVETTVKAIDSNLQSAVAEKVERPADEAQNCRRVQRRNLRGYKARSGSNVST